MLRESRALLRVLAFDSRVLVVLIVEERGKEREGIVFVAFISQQSSASEMRLFVIYVVYLTLNVSLET